MQARFARGQASAAAVAGIVAYTAVDVALVRPAAANGGSMPALPP